MATAYSAEIRTAIINRPIPARLVARVWIMLGGFLRAPDVGVRPRGLMVSRRGWRRNSALIMSVVEQRLPATRDSGRDH